MQLDDKLCYCFHVTQRKVVNFIRIHKPQVPSQMSECGGAGTGCGWCVPFLKHLFEARQAPIELTPEEYAQQRAAYVKESGRKIPHGGTPAVDAKSDS
ncbi:MAG: (2Fe-2S)-binding protein [Planctomycetaceae bacterium]|nr:(2Fe-2S)-binding protein [Planctomycetaceae bacterium]